ncbi:hypothetical protein RhiJN_01579 [Ceratobasidium sp. AG-Ba]|nr:hypothetical protein RhiJN_01579 [Ceratobasidium sp. AG-Ba]
MLFSIFTHVVLSALGLLLGLASPAYASTSEWQIIVRVPTIVTSKALFFSMSTEYSYSPSPPSASGLTLIPSLARFVKHATDTRGWISDQRHALSHTMCHTRPPFINSPYALRAYHILSVLRSELCPTRPSIIDSLPRPAWRFAPRRPPPAVPLLPPPGTPVVHLPTKTQTTPFDGPALPEPGFVRARRPPHLAVSHALETPVSEYTWREDVCDSLLAIWLDARVWVLNLWKRLCARMRVHDWLLWFKWWKDEFAPPRWAICASVVCGLAIPAAEYHTVMRRRDRLLKHRQRQSRSSSRPTLVLVPRPCRPLFIESRSSKLPTPDEPTRLVQFVYNLEIHVYRVSSARRVSSDNRPFSIRGLSNDRARIDGLAWQYIDRVFGRARMGRRWRGLRLGTRVVRRTIVGDLCEELDEEPHVVTLTKRDKRRLMRKRGYEVFQSVDEFLASLGECDDMLEWNDRQFWSAPDSPTPSRPATPLLSPTPRQVVAVRIESSEERGEGVDRDMWTHEFWPT